MKPKYAISAIASILGLMFIAAYVTGGDLNPDNTPSPTMRTLDELYKNIQPGLPSDWKPYPDAAQTTGQSAVYLTIAEIDGSCQAQGHPNSIRIVGLGHQVELPYNWGTGQVSGSRIYGPIIVTKYIDKSSPLLYQALAQNQTKQQAELVFDRINSTGQLEWYFKITLDDVKIIKIQTAYPNIEQISLAFRKIKWRWQDDSVIEFEDQPYSGS